MKKTGEYIREKRQSKGYSYRVLGRLAGVSHQHIRDIEEGKKEPSFTLLMKVINALMVDICKFLKETGYTDAEIEEAKGLRRIPVISWAQAGHWREVVEISGEYDEYVETDSKGVFGLSIFGQNNTAFAQISDGDYYMVGYGIGSVSSGAAYGYKNGPAETYNLDYYEDSFSHTSFHIKHIAKSLILIKGQ